MLSSMPDPSLGFQSRSHDHREAGQEQQAGPLFNTSQSPNTSIILLLCFQV